MFGILVVTHDDLAAQLVKAARNIVGENLKNITAVSIGWEQDLDMARDKIKAAIKEVCPTGEAVILTDMFGGTPTNVSLTFLEEGKIEVLTGVNLPMVIKLAQLQITDSTTLEAARLARDRGKSTILIASEALHGNDDGNKSKG